MALEPLIFCYSDLWLGNFIIDEQKRVAVIDFADVSILPSSFLKYAILDSIHKLGRDISDLVTVPSTPGVDNTNAVLACQASLSMAPCGFYELGLELLGNAEGEESIEAVPEDKPLMDAEGRRVTVSYQELHPDYEPDAEIEQSAPWGDGSPPPGWIEERLRELREEAIHQSEPPTELPNIGSTPHQPQP